MRLQLALCLALFAALPTGAAELSWTGQWDTRWREGGVLPDMGPALSARTGLLAAWQIVGVLLLLAGSLVVALAAGWIAPAALRLVQRMQVRLSRLDPALQDAMAAPALEAAA